MCILVKVAVLPMQLIWVCKLMRCIAVRYFTVASLRRVRSVAASEASLSTANHNNFDFMIATRSHPSRRA